LLLLPLRSMDAPTPMIAIAPAIVPMLTKLLVILQNDGQPAVNAAMSQV
jgi:hypothetical protein